MRVYLDWNATAPPLVEALDAMREAAREAWGNPASVHAHGRAARARVEEARAAVAELSLSDPRDVVFTSGATEANNIAIRSAFGERPAREGAARASALPVFLTSRLEHPSVTQVAEALEREGRGRVRWLAVREDGRVSLEDLAGALAWERDVRLVAVQAVNHETGVIQPVAEVAGLCHSTGVRLHVDAVQAWGRVLFDVCGDTLSLAAHKIRGPKGVGALVARPGVPLSPVLLGGAQERGLRPGTVDPVAASGFAVAARCAKGSHSRYELVAGLRDELERALLGLFPLARVNGTGPRAPHVTNLSWPGLSGPELVAALDLEGVSVSSGSACSAGTSEPSAVLRAMLGDERAACAVRISLGDATTRQEIAEAVKAFARVVARAR